VELLLTQSRGDEERCAREVLQRNAETIAVLGGDGTISRVAREFVRAQSPTPLTIFGAGTGNDFAKTLGAPIHDYPAMAELARKGQSRTIDVGRVDANYFINSAGFGFDAEVVSRTLEPGRLSGKAKYAVTALDGLIHYHGFEASIMSARSLPDRATPSSVAVSEFHTHSFSPMPARRVEGKWLTMVFANGGYFGGSFEIAPGATVDDGMLDAVLIRDMSPMRRFAVFARATGGRHTRESEVEFSRNSRWTIEFSDPPVYQADGELFTADSASVEVAVVPGALRVTA
jgi:diacylglycerol kinase (ATP)